MESHAILIYSTCNTEQEARHIAGTLLEERLIACANLLPSMISLYRWQGSVEEATEIVMLFKTTADKQEVTITRLKQLHSYTCPCAIVLPVSGGNPDFLRWIEESVTPVVMA